MEVCGLGRERCWMVLSGVRPYLLYEWCEGAQNKLVLWHVRGHDQGMAAVEDHVRHEGLLFAELFSSSSQLRAATHHRD